MNQVRSFQDFQTRVTNDPQLRAALQNDPVGTLQKLDYSPQTDPWLFRGVVYSLGAVVLLIVAGIITLMLLHGGLEESKVPTILTALGSAAIGALAGLLAPSPRNNPA